MPAEPGGAVGALPPWPPTPAPPAPPTGAPPLPPLPLTPPVQAASCGPHLARVQSESLQFSREMHSSSCNRLPWASVVPLLAQASGHELAVSGHWSIHSRIWRQDAVSTGATVPVVPPLPVAPPAPALMPPAPVGLGIEGAGAGAVPTV